MTSPKLEIERKFLVTDPTMLRGRQGIRVEQVYLFADDSTLLRVTRRAGLWRLTVKDAGPALVRREFHVTLPEDMGSALFNSSKGRLSGKKRYQVPFGGREWFIDVHDGTSDPIAEVELTHENEPLQLPPWCGAEVTDEWAFLDLAMSHPRHSSTMTTGQTGLNDKFT